MKARHLVLIAASVFMASSVYASAKDIPYYKNVRMKVGQTIVLKGVRGECNAKSAPSFASLRRLPKPKLGVLLDGGPGTVFSKNCDRKVPARAIKYKATKSGKEMISVYEDRITIRID